MGRCAIATILTASAAACVATVPDWYPVQPHAQRVSAYERLLVSSGYGRSDERAAACDIAEERARTQMIELLVRESETRADMVAAAGGPSRLRGAIEAFAARDSVRANRTREVFDDATRECWLELSWPLPRNLANAVVRVIGSAPSEREVADELRRALGGPEPATAEPDGPVVQQLEATAPTPTAAAAKPYPGWFLREVVVEDCPTHRFIFAGAPGGGEARWLEVKETRRGWIVIDDARVTGTTWPEVPELIACE